MLTDITKTLYGVRLRRIRAVKALPAHNVCPGDLGGWVPTNDCLSHDNQSWVADNAEILSPYARVEGDALVSGRARVWDCALVHQRARVLDDACVFGEAQVYGRAIVGANASVGDHAELYGWAHVAGNVQVLGTAILGGTLKAQGNEIYKDGFWDQNGDLSVMPDEQLIYLATQGFDKLSA